MMNVDTLASGLRLVNSCNKNQKTRTIEKSVMESDTLEAVTEEININLHKETSNISSLGSCIGMENEVTEVSVVRSPEVCNRAQFWGAVGIFIEKPHILNRRLCGVADLWWGKLSPPQTDSTHKSLDTAEATENSTVNTHNNLDKLVLTAWKLLQGSDSMSGDTSNDDHHKMDADEYKTNDRTSGNEEKLLEDLKNLLRSSAFEDIPMIEGQRFEPWPLLTGGSKTVFAVVRRNLPKQTLRFSTPLELVLLDGRHGRCSVVSSMSNPPLLPCRPYHLQHELEGGRLEVVCYGGSHNKNQPISGSAAHPSDPVTTPAGSEVSVTDDDGSAVDNDGSAVDNDGSAADNDGSAADNDGSAAVNDGSTADNDGSAADNDGSGADNDCSAADNDGSAADNDVSHAKSRVPPSFTSGVQWLKDVVLPRVAKWSTQVSEEGATGSNGSLTNVDLQAYSALYSSLKSKYADKLVKSWTERTDPHKFVHEDIGIATYILLLWAKLPRPQRFLDLGCGNGLLVYILASEGHQGQGLDIRKRAIWDTFPSFVELKEHVVRPHDGCLPSEADWLLGNHSDELTPWIPVMAARASHTCSFFVLPCCPHDFTAKFLRRNSSMSQYADYLDYVQEVGEQCGFVMERDRLKIPSTKRVCFVGRTRNHAQDARQAVLQRLQQFIDQRVAHYINNQPAKKDQEGGAVEDMNGGEHSNGLGIDHSPGQNGTSSSATSPNLFNGANGDLLTNGIDKVSAALGLATTVPGSDTRSIGGGKLWGAGFVARGREQRTRNCTQLRQDVKDDLIGAVVRVVLGTEPLEACSPWQEGSCTPLSEVAEALGPHRLQQLKKECGGLQTLLRNHRHIFNVQRGSVVLRSPGRVPEDPKRHRPCWFFLHHPQGCPNTSTCCIYDHAPLPGTVTHEPLAKVDRRPVPAKVDEEVHV